MVQCSSLGAGLYRLLQSFMLLDPFERRLALEKLLGQATMEWSADQQRQQTWGKGQGRELHPDDLLKRKQTGPGFSKFTCSVEDSVGAAVKVTLTG